MSISAHVSSSLSKYIVKLSDFRLGKTLGAGPSGEVIYAFHSPTGKICAIKKLILRKLEGKHLKQFCRELEVLVRLDHPNILPFMGWTSKFPYAIVTEFAENGSLYAALRQKKHTKLTPTMKTKIAIGIANGMAYLHQKGIMHRNLKSSNVLLNRNYVPMIGDFGLSRDESDEAQFMTKEVGSPHWMAPELFVGGKYDNKVDVYSFGILLWEMLTETTPFHGLSGLEIGAAVTKQNLRPQFPSDTPKQFSQFIEDLWQADPTKRLTFSQILRRFTHKKVMFPGTNVNDIDLFLNNDFKPTPASSSKEKPKERPAPLSSQAAKIAHKKKQISPDDESNFTTQQRRHMRREAQQALLDPTSYFDKLPDPTSPDFESKFKLLIGITTVDNASLFFRTIEPLFKKRTIPDQTMVLILTELNKLIRQDDHILQEFVDSGIYTKLSFNHLFALITMKILLYTTSKIPQAIDTKLLKKINPYLSTYSRPLVRILSNSLIVFDKVSNNWEVADYIISNSEQLLFAGIELCQSLHYLCQQYPQFAQYRLEYVIPIMIKLLESEDIEIVKNAYSFICDFFDTNTLIPINILVQHLQNRQLQDYVISYLLRQQDSSFVNDELINALISLLSTRQESIYIIYNYICRDKRIQQGLVNFPWNETTIPLQHRIGILCLLLCENDNIEPISKSNGICQLLTEIVEMNQVESIEMVIQIVFKIGKVNPKFYESLSDAQFFQSYLKKVPMLNSGVAVKTSLTLIDLISRTCFVEDFLLYVPYMIQLVAQVSDYTLPSLSALATLSVHRKSVAVLRNYGIERYLEQLEKYANMTPYVNIIKRSLQQ
ncbi:TKL family protein kinase [Histomonas meleagridis]|uniref:TKL family protein kinase n=1 Tax=Histomonas meleagridis TaxID=135588 RepID=UPI00355A6842|nr:TKL family protein kinase [Histomonas meleagridis]KAH0800526.1 TKL family protein kinase [Histomonas meleagridis]